MDIALNNGEFSFTLHVVTVRIGWLLGGMLQVSGASHPWFPQHNPCSPCKETKVGAIRA